MTLHYFVTLAMQHSMIWVGMDVLPANTSKSQRNDLTCWLVIGRCAVGADVGPDAAPRRVLETARRYGREWRRSRCPARREGTELDQPALPQAA